MDRVPDVQTRGRPRCGRAVAPETKTLENGSSVIRPDAPVLVNRISAACQDLNTFTGLVMPATREELKSGSHRHDASCDELRGHTPKYPLHQLEDAVTAVLHEGMSQAGAAKKHRVPLTTIRHYTSPAGRLANSAPGDLAYDRVLTDLEENQLIDVMFVFFASCVFACLRSPLPRAGACLLHTLFGALVEFCRSPTVRLLSCCWSVGRAPPRNC